MYSSKNRAVVALVCGWAAVAACAGKDDAVATVIGSSSGLKAAAAVIADAGRPISSQPKVVISDTGSAKAGEAVPVGATIVPGGEPMTIRLAGPHARYRFSASAGTGYGLALTGVTYAPSPGTLTATLRSAEGAVLAGCSFGPSSSCNLDPSMFATTGSYLLDFDAHGVAATSFTVVLTKDASGTVVIDGDGAVPALRVGQNARYQFRGTAGQPVSVVVSGNALDDGNPDTSNDANISVFSPSSPSRSAIATGSLAPTATGMTFDLTLPETGAYTIWIDPVALDRGSVHVDVKSYAEGVLTMDGVTPVELGLGRNGRYSFTATAGMGYAVAISSLNFTPADGQLQVALRHVDGTLITSCGFITPTSCNLDPGLFPTTGTYVVEFDATAVTTTRLRAVVSADVTGMLALGRATRVTTTLPGQNARYRFEGTAGRTVNVVLDNDTIDDGNLANGNATSLLVFGPDGSTVGSGAIHVSRPGEGPSVHRRTIPVTLPETGMYTVLIDPQGLDLGSVDLAVE